MSLRMELPPRESTAGLARTKVFPFGRERGGRFYPQKQIKVVYTLTEESTTTVTVFVYYGKWD